MRGYITQAQAKANQRASGCRRCITTIMLHSFGSVRWVKNFMRRLFFPLTFFPSWYYVKRPVIESGTYEKECIKLH